MYLDLKTFCYKDDLKCHNISVKNNTVDFISTCLKHVWINFFNNSMNINAKLPEILFTPKIGPIFILLEMPCKNNRSGSTPRKLTLQSVRAVWFLWWWHSGSYDMRKTSCESDSTKKKSFRMEITSFSGFGFQQTKCEQKKIISYSTRLDDNLMKPIQYRAFLNFYWTT